MVNFAVLWMEAVPVVFGGQEITVKKSVHLECLESIAINFVTVNEKAPATQ